ncbi:hypothetical protein [Marisediminicola sp. LYQ134]|uniref:hypothetical protein n=1 Tax=Marisediminicola sp. LYQ134 TaxID=3391061 RepID=UPI0039836A01
MFSRALRADLAAALSISERAAETLMGRARILVENLPNTMAMLRAGRVTERHATIMADEAAGLNDAERARFEHLALPIAEQHERARRDREVVIEPGRDGMGWLSAYLPNPELVAIGNKLHATARGLAVEGETRTLAQVMADVLTDTLLDDGRLLPPAHPRANSAPPSSIHPHPHPPRDRSRALVRQRPLRGAARLEALPQIPRRDLPVRRTRDIRSRHRRQRRAPTCRRSEPASRMPRVGCYGRNSARSRAAGRGVRRVASIRTTTITTTTITTTPITTVRTQP